MRTESLYHGEHVFPIAERVIEVASKYECSPAQIAVAWLLGKPEVTAPIVGVSKVSQLDDLVAAAAITLEAEDVTYLEELYTPVENLLSIGSS
jgi:aryl-alcohol dehydrogenase-like predicted oxidoreductase